MKCPHCGCRLELVIPKPEVPEQVMERKEFVAPPIDKAIERVNRLTQAERKK